MAHYQYKALGSDGRIVRGLLEADSSEEVVATLRQRQQYPIAAAIQGTGPSALSGNWLGGRGAKRFDDRLVANFMAALVSLLQAGMPLARALDLLAGLRDFRSVRTRIGAVATSVRAGVTLADALQQDSNFSHFVVAMIRAGESGGTLTETSALLARYLERAHATRQSLLSALLYPAFLLVTAALSIGVMMIFVIPAFAPLFEGANRALPFGASLLMGISDFLIVYWWIIALAIGGSFLAFRQLRTSDRWATRMDRRLLSLPLFGRLLAQIEAEKFCRILSVLLGNAVPLPNSLDLTKEVLGNRIFRKLAGDAAIKVREGGELSELLGRARYFPEGTVDFLRIGEESGDVPGALARQADLLTSTTKSAIDRTLALAVPIMTIGLGVVVGAIIVTLLTAILSINELAV